jgi:hypothetical protein
MAKDKVKDKVKEQVERQGRRLDCTGVAFSLRRHAEPVWPNTRDMRETTNDTAGSRVVHGDTGWSI